MKEQEIKKLEEMLSRNEVSSIMKESIEKRLAILKKNKIVQK